MTEELVAVDRERARLVGERLASVLALRRARASGAEQPRSATFWLLLLSIAHRTAAVRGRIDGRELVGSDFMSAAAERAYRGDPSLFCAEVARGATEESLAAMFADDDGVPRVDRLRERAALVRSTARKLVREFDGTADRIHAAADGWIGEGGSGPGIRSLLREFEAYGDPVAKKANLLLLVLDEAGVWSYRDPSSLACAVDYHVTRVALRTGMVVPAPHLVSRLVAGATADQPTDVAVRRAVGEGCMELVGAARDAVRDMGPYACDKALWSVGRGCCAFAGAACEECGDRRDGGLGERFSIRFAQPGECVLRPVCRGAGDREVRALREPVHDTPWH